MSEAQPVIYIQCEDDEAAERARLVLLALDYDVREAEDLDLLHRRAVAGIKARLLGRYLGPIVDAMLLTDDVEQIAVLARVSRATAVYWRSLVLDRLGLENRDGLIALAAGEAAR